jgi:hypothetical protein
VDASSSSNRCPSTERISSAPRKRIFYINNHQGEVTVKRRSSKDRISLDLEGGSIDKLPTAVIPGLESLIIPPLGDVLKRGVGKAADHLTKAPLVELLVERSGRFHEGSLVGGWLDIRLRNASGNGVSIDVCSVKIPANADTRIYRTRSSMNMGGVDDGDREALTLPLLLPANGSLPLHVRFTAPLPAGQSVFRDCSLRIRYGFLNSHDDVDEQFPFRLMARS